MTSQEQISDEIYAQQLQADEEREARERSSRFTLQPGQAAHVKLHHIVTSRQIGEVLMGTYVASGLMTFEMLNKRGFRMRVKEGNGAVEFSSKNDSKCRFVIEPTPTGGMYLKPAQYVNMTNRFGGIGWYLAMSQEGVLSGNAGRDQMSQWMLVAASAPGATTNAAQFVQPQQQPLPPPASVAAQAAPPPAHNTSRSRISGTFDNLFGRSNTDSNAGERPSDGGMSANPLLGGTLPADERDSSTQGFELQPVVSSSATRPVASTTTSDAFVSTDVQSSGNQENGGYGASATGHIPPSTAPSPAGAVVNHFPVQPGSGPSTRPASVRGVQSNKFPGYDANKDALLQYFGTSEGQSFLSKPKLIPAQQLHAFGVLKDILHRSDWPEMANRFRDFQSLAETKKYPFLGASAEFNARMDGIFPVKQVATFLDSGYAIVERAVPEKLVTKALRLSNYWLTRSATSSVVTPQNAINATLRRRARGRVQLIGGISQDQDMLALYYESDLIYIAQILLGAAVNHPVQCEAITAPPDLDVMGIEAASLQQGNKWVIEGFDGTGEHSPFNLLIGIALTDMMMPDMGNFCVHEMSHLMLMDDFKHQVQMCSTLFSENPDVYNKPDLGMPPKQLLLRAGDAFLCTQRLAYSVTSNSAGLNNTTIIFFRIAHQDNDSMKAASLDNMWLQFSAAQSYIDQRSKASVANAQASSDSGSGSNSSDPSNDSLIPSAPIAARAPGMLLDLNASHAPVPSAATAVSQSFENFDLLNMNDNP